MKRDRYEVRRYPIAMDGFGWRVIDSYDGRWYSKHFGFKAWEAAVATADAMNAKGAA